MMIHAANKLINLAADHFDPDTFCILIDNYFSACVTNDIKDLIFNLLNANKKGFFKKVCFPKNV